MFKRLEKREYREWMNEWVKSKKTRGGGESYL